MVNNILLAVLVMTLSTPVFALQDPTRPLSWAAPKALVKQKTEHSVPVLQSIICRESSPCYAVLNNKVAEQGQYVAGYKVKSITSKEVVVVKGDSQWQLALFALDIKQ
ncbi:hypothetical protein MACH09_02620 [Vibrio sp. MACH09]|uniref:MSHA biogenesis protein MshK n=1 Tax=unclassified Vibrio TaxID=2614977 RepID=UPI001493B23B|nr:MULTISPECIES: MSHA biogenesis protein MshK [unclassified Vibrio]NOI65914.1 MSHA biogenesis protein MshK [Vibrio sp. 99-8-1]GLO59754.1 hypothetical protein MACH09_02620 [Vibrio sp. MACH09]